MRQNFHYRGLGHGNARRKTMKTLIGPLALFVALSVEASDQKITVDTLITCQQEDGDQWLEVGITNTEVPGLAALIVSHNVDDNSSKLLAHRRVYAYHKNDRTIYEDAQKTIQLIVLKKQRSIRGSLSLRQDGPGIFIHKGLFCFEDSSISFD
jgi:hypothetical protein